MLTLLLYSVISLSVCLSLGQGLHRSWNESLRTVLWPSCVTSTAPWASVKPGQWLSPCWANSGFATCPSLRCKGTCSWQNTRLQRCQSWFHSIQCYCFHTHLVLVCIDRYIPICLLRSIQRQCYWKSLSSKVLWSLSKWFFFYWSPYSEHVTF